MVLCVMRHLSSSMHGNGDNIETNPRDLCRHKMSLLCGVRCDCGVGGSEDVVNDDPTCDVLFLEGGRAACMSLAG